MASLADGAREDKLEVDGDEEDTDSDDGVSASRSKAGFCLSFLERSS